MKPSEILLQVKAKKDKNLGICGEFYYFSKFYESKDFLTFMAKHNIKFSNWPEFSGSPMYPIKSYQIRSTPALTFECMSYKRKLWDRRTKYGKARWALLDWLIAEFQAKGA